MMRWVIRGLGALAALGCAILLLGWALSSPTPPRPDALTGHQTLTLTPPHRTGPVTVHLWYPAEGDGNFGLIGQNALFIGTWKAEGATPRPGPHPLVLFSHGSGG